MNPILNLLVSQIRGIRSRLFRSEGVLTGATGKTRNREIGDRGEESAVRYLQKQGYRILLRNFLCPGGEIDIIAEDCSTIAFVEVKTRSPGSYISPVDAVDEGKQARIRLAAKTYLAGFRTVGRVRYDIVSVYLQESGVVDRVELTKEAFS